MKSKRPPHPGLSLLVPPRLPMIFVTGTHTDVGKTVVTAALAQICRQRGLRPGIFKPVASGCPVTPPAQRRRYGPRRCLDAEMALTAGGWKLDRNLLQRAAPVRLLDPIAPGIAARLANEPLDWKAMASSLASWQDSADLLLIEGAGGLMVPLEETGTLLMIDLIQALQAPVLLVSGHYLGTINHTLLTLEALRQRRIPILGLVLNGVPRKADLLSQANVESLATLSNVPCLACLPRLRGPIQPPLPQAFLEALEPMLGGN